MEQENAMEFYERVTSGTDNYKTITIEHETGAEMPGFEIYAIGKKSLARTIQRLPDDMFEAVEGAEDPEDAEAQLEDNGGDLSAVNESTVEAFEDLCSESLDHPEYTSVQIENIVAELNFETLFELGTEIINMSVEDTGSIRGFHEQG